VIRDDIGGTVHGSKQYTVPAIAAYRPAHEGVADNVSLGHGDAGFTLIEDTQFDSGLWTAGIGVMPFQTQTGD
jgi:hypothetical protein